MACFTLKLKAVRASGARLLETDYTASSLRISHLEATSRSCRRFGARDGVVGWGTGTGIFHWHNTSSSTLGLVLTQPLIELSTRNISWG